MVIDIKMCRFEDAPWGFRLVGGADYDYPLTVVKVIEGGIADKAGLRVEDVIVRINDVAALPLAHEEAHKIIKRSGNVLYFGVFRNDETELSSETQKFPIYVNENRSFCNVQISDELIESNFLPDLPDRPCSALSENSEIKLVEDEIAAVLSNEANVLEEQNIQMSTPKPGVCMASEVLRSLKEQIFKTKEEKEKENRKWSTFLQKPNRPVPKSKLQLEAERRAANAYKITIVKSTERKKSPMPEDIVKEIPKTSEEPKEEVVELEQLKEVKEDESLITDSEVPSLEDLIIRDADIKSVESECVVENLSVSEGLEEQHGEKCEDLTTKDETSEIESPTTSPPEQEKVQLDDSNDNLKSSHDGESEALVNEKTTEELLLEKQLYDVQKQLEALSSLPSTIQTTLDAVTKQLSELLPNFRLNQNVSEGSVETKEVSETVETLLETTENTENGKDGQDLSVEAVEQLKSEEAADREVMLLDIKENSNLLGADPGDTQAGVLSNKERDRDNNIKKPKGSDVIEELEEHWEQKHNNSGSKRSFGPLTPASDRPLVLPGGRRWYRPKDAYNDEFIAETLSAQAELITGHTLGVNFMKYQKPEKKIDLDRSEVYKIIHHLDRQPVHGIELRPPLVAAEADIRKAVQ